MTKEIKEILMICKNLTKHQLINKASIETIVVRKLLDRKIKEYLNKNNLTIDETKK